MRDWATFGRVAIVAAVAGTVALSTERSSRAADHLDPPGRTDPAQDATPDKSADIADVYSWFTADKVVIAVTFAGPQATTLPATYDRDILYTINISNGPNKALSTFPVTFRFGADTSGGGAPRYGVRIDGLPGVTGPLIGPVETDLVKDGVIARAGLFDDPFFFDLQGFRTTLSTGTFSFDRTRNFFAGQNLTAIVLEIPRARLQNGTNPVGIWATTARFGGQL